MHNFRKLNIWTKSISFVSDIYKITNLFPKEEKFGLISQIQRASVSIPANIAEGSAKSSNKDFSRFLEISLGSSFEVETELQVALNLLYIDEASFLEIQNKLIELQKMISSFKDQLK